MGGRVVLAMSGGVDSSVAAHLLKEQGHEVIGLFMRTGAHGDDLTRRAKTCCSATDAVDAQAVADRLDIPFYALDFERDFARIMDQFADEYAAGRTPNPCVLCNIWLKFGKLWSYGKQVGADFVATGHYARKVEDPRAIPGSPEGSTPGRISPTSSSGSGASCCRTSCCRWAATPRPRSGRIARDLDLPVHDKPDSQEICFVPDDDYLGSSASAGPGSTPRARSSTRRATVLAGIAGSKGSPSASGEDWGSPWASRATSSRSSRHPDRDRRPPRGAGQGWPGGLEVRLAAPRPRRPDPCLAQIRARHKAVPATVEPIGGGRVRVVFDEPQLAVTPGQVVTRVSGGPACWAAAGSSVGSTRPPVIGPCPGECPMVTVGMYYDVLPGEGPAFQAKFDAVVDALRGASRPPSSFLYQRVDDPDSYAILSEWDDADAFHAFIRSAAFREVDAWGRRRSSAIPPATRSTLAPKMRAGLTEAVRIRGSMARPI